MASQPKAVVGLVGGIQAGCVWWTLCVKAERTCPGGERMREAVTDAAIVRGKGPHAHCVCVSLFYLC